MNTHKWGASGLRCSIVMVILGAIGFSLSLQAQTIRPITTVDITNHTGYFSDPYLVPFSGASSTYISGTTQKYLFCSGDLSPQCGQETPNSVDFSDMQTQAEQAGAQICSIAGLRPFQETSGLWDMVLVLHMDPIGNCDASSHWNVLVHASPNTRSTTPPVSWTADAVLVGSFSDSSAQANYDGRYFEDSGQLYLIYVKSLSISPQRFGLVAQAMVSPTTLDSTGPVLLLQPNPDNNDPLNSEGYSGLANSFKLVESGNITKINGKYVLVYSAGQYDKKTYKAAVAYSDTFLPAAGETYRKVTMPDPSGVWGNTNDEVVYLLQSQEQNWTGYVASQVVAPGVATVVPVGPNGSFWRAWAPRSRSGVATVAPVGPGSWVLVFAGYAPNDTGSGPNGNTYLGSKRRPFYVDLNVSIPTDISVAQATETELASWITLSTQ